MHWLNQLPGFQRSASGLEWVLWKRMPHIAAAGTLLPLLAIGLAYLGQPESPSPAELRSFTLLQYTVLDEAATRSGFQVGEFVSCGHMLQL